MWLAPDSAGQCCPLIKPFRGDKGLLMHKEMQIAVIKNGVGGVKQSLNYKAPGTQNWLGY